MQVEVRIIHFPDVEGENQANLAGLNQAEPPVANEKEQIGHMSGTGSYSSFPPLLDGNLKCATNPSNILVERNAVQGGRHLDQLTINQRANQGKDHTKTVFSICV
ncbi:unnamed protein product [Lupinus luteus]|uniref:Uncharacterized protein n=1 Tax=Lupinus luteus TaxID=3873 RepID=A0AAV1XAE6_LUPLU